ncbi:DNA polymerase III subunit epsilon [Bajunvirus bajun]|uniref:DNA polymerase III subunit epsilon n=1 Tax=Brevundimonas phage vB_BgoS-Bajun TaxID=2948594 RepID=A0A9E7N7Q6_9CAUD|nr:DNA polymerase III subunit epsilon [Brevundimonas phage vB_BgoS-Bajun]
MILTYDTETTGFLNKKLPLDHEDQARIVQLGAVLDDADGKEIMRLDVIIRHPDLPQVVLDGWDGAAKFHGITKAHSDRVGMTEVIALEAFLDMVAVADMIVGHNIKGFDNDMVRANVRRVLGRPTLDPFEGKSIFDTMPNGAALMRRPQGKVKLMTLHQHLTGEEFDGAHTAISDVLATRRCFYALQDIVAGRRPHAA